MGELARVGPPPSRLRWFRFLRGTCREGGLVSLYLPRFAEELMAWAWHRALFPSPLFSVAALLPHGWFLSSRH